MSTHTSPAGSSPPLTGPELEHHELLAAREIAHAFLTAEQPEEVFRLALARVSPLVGAAFACVYVLADEGDVMDIAAAHNWPARFEPWLGRMRVRLGAGPSGAAALERRTIEVADLAAAGAGGDAALAEWEEVGRELGFRALVALPLATHAGVLGALTFYYADASRFTDEQRAVWRLVADMLAAVAEKATLITHLRRANAELGRRNAALVEARRVKDEFLTNISHELRTPLTAVIGYVALLADGLSGPLTEPQLGTLGQVKRASERLLTLIDDLLELATLKRGGLEVVLDSFDPREPLEEALERASGRPVDVGLALELPPEPLPPLRSDRKKIVKVLVSLLGNAYKFTVRGGVQVRLELVNGRVAYHVHDTGIGIPSDLLEHVFDEFRQVDGTATRRYGGPGLGLALARRLARLLGGDIEARSMPGEGSTFSLVIPLESTPTTIATSTTGDA
ncbi:MAG TPA: GAF domain-containing sensor histidine kinase [Gemmatimonadaceae bacterium]|nr:GAF domain-containing sensor histidine kinase [Gemmatimonadaceae bacterium]